MKCIDLKKRFGSQYRVRGECETYGKRGPILKDPWLQVLLCRNGHICPWGGDKLAAFTAKAGRVAKRLKALPFAKVVQDGSDGANVVFSVERFEEVAKLIDHARRAWSITCFRGSGRLWWR